MPLHSGVWPVRRLRSSITIATFPGRNARAVRRFNLFAPASGPVDRWGGSYRRPLQPAVEAMRRLMNSSNHATRSTNHNYKEMKDLSKDAPKDAARRLAVDEAGVGQRVDNFLLRRLKGVPKSHIYRILRSGEVRLNSRRVKPDARLAAGDLLRIPPLRTPASAAERRKPPAPSIALPVLYEDETLLVQWGKPVAVFRTHAGRLSPQRKNIYSQGIVLKELRDRIKLLRPFVEHWYGRVRSGPAMAGKFALLCRYIKQRRRLALHVT